MDIMDAEVRFYWFGSLIILIAILVVYGLYHFSVSEKVRIDTVNLYNEKFHRLMEEACDLINSKGCRPCTGHRGSSMRRIQIAQKRRTIHRLQ